MSTSMRSIAISPPVGVGVSDDESDDESDQQEGGGCTDKYEGICNDGNRFIYSLEELKNINKTKEEDSEIAIILRKSDPDFE